MPKRTLKLVGYALRNRTRGDSARLRMTNHASGAESEFKTYLGELRRFAGSRLPAYDDDLIVAYEPFEFVFEYYEREFRIVR